MPDKASKQELNKKAARAGFFFVFMQMLVRGVTFLLTPVYTRLVSKAQYGELRVYESWLLIIVPVMSLSLYRSIERAKYDHEDDFDHYVSSVVMCSYISIIICVSVISLFFFKLFTDRTDMDLLMYIYMVFYTFAYTATLSFQRREKQMMRYKANTAASALMMIPAVLLSIALLYWGNINNMKDSLVDLRIIGYFSPQIIGGLILAVIMFKQGGAKPDISYWKYAVAYSLPLIPETLSIQIMNQADKIMVKNMTGAENAGAFSLATTVSFIIWIVEDAVWGAWQPWLYEKINRGEDKDIKKPWYTIVGVFAFFSWALVVFGPELIIILGGKKYADAVYLVAPMVTGTLFRFFSNIFSAIENYEKKTVFCGIGTVCAMILNIVLNYYFIGHFGYQAAAFTTAASYLCLLIIQGILESLVSGRRIVSLGLMSLICAVLFGVNLLSIYLYDLNWYIRWIFFAFVSIILYVVFRKRLNGLISLLLKRR